MKRRVEIYFWEGYISVAPTIINLANSLAEKGHPVFIYTRVIQEYAPETELNAAVKILRFDRQKYLLRLKNWLTKVPFLYKYQQDIINLQLLLNSYKWAVKKSRKESGNNKSCLLIGVDYLGLQWANLLKRRNDSLIYLSLEIEIPAQLHSKNLIDYLRRKEIQIHSHKVALTLIQDKYRMEILKKLNNLTDKAKFAILTNSPRDHKQPIPSSKNFFEEKFDLPQNSFKILSAGMISEGVLSTDIARVFNFISDKTIYLIYHERDKINEKSDYIQNIKNLGGKNLVLSLEPVPYEMVYQIFSSADIGLAIYNPEWGDNFSSIVGASGKLSHYLQFGIPVICYDLPGFREIIEQYNCGIVIKNVEELDAAITAIKANYNNFSKGAYTCYRDCYNFDSQFEVIYTSWKNLFDLS
ncbi:glycosyltransferase family protein [Ferruginibacter albus]|uniref:hypothetical protein n=1 Tax=Ferruginibacter albus TaxID=2875540 RepID=UPI001CC7DB32|nr:hypothetical protein [Ferruginibacter albus]UAY50693.1 hypothetical protein K9M53_08805 [Ferruginibacter albus]